VALRELLVTNYAGATVALLDLPSSRDLLVSGDRLYVASPADSAILVFDTATLKHVATYAIGQTTEPARLASTSGKIWFSYDNGRLGSIDLATSAVEMSYSVTDTWYAIYDLATSAAAPDRLVVSGRGIRYDRAAILDLSSGTPELIAQYDGFRSSTGWVNATFTADGTGVVPVGGRPGPAIRLRAADLVQTDTYAVGDPPSAVAAAADGSVVIGDMNGSPPGLAYFSPTGTVRRMGSVTTGEFAGAVVDAIEIEPGTHRVFAVAGSTNAAHPVSLQVFDPSPVSTTLMLDHSGAVFNYGTTVTFTAHLGATYRGRAVAIYADPAGADQARRLLVSKTADAHGNVTASLKLTRSTVISAAYAGDDLTKPASATATVNTRASVSTAVAKYYKRSGSTYVFHKKANPVLTTTMTAYAKRQQYLTVEYYSGGKWHTAKAAYYPLTGAGKSTVTFTGTHKTGVTYRVRATYLNGKSGDTVNATTYGAYRYFRFTN
jgi:hypothetical protein